MTTVRQSVWIDAEPDQVWRVYADPLRVPDWQTGRPRIADVKGAGGEAGSSYMTRRGPTTARTVVVTGEPPRLLVTHTSALLQLQLDLESRLEPVDGGTRLDLAATTHWPRGLGLVGRIVELIVLSDREAKKELAALKALVEGKA